MQLYSEMKIRIPTLAASALAAHRAGRVELSFILEPLLVLNANPVLMASNLVVHHGHRSTGDIMHQNFWQFTLLFECTISRQRAALCVAIQAWVQLPPTAVLDCQVAFLIVSVLGKSAQPG